MNMTANGTPQQAVMETETEIQKEAYLSPAIRSRMEKLEKLREKILANGENATAFYKVATDLGLRTSEANAVQKLGITTKTQLPDGRNQFVYRWEGGEITQDLTERVYKKAKEIARESSKKSQLNRKEKKRREEEEKRAKKKAEAERIKRVKEEKQKSQGAVLDPNNLEFINNLKARSEGLDPERIAAKTKQVEKPNIPISVQVTTEGDKKTVTIQIEV